ncbi:MAG: efflux RND transporter periplasmic adaptor subunit [Marinilabilia sp.]
MYKRKTFIISLLILAGAALVVVLIFLTEPTASREGATKETAMLVDVTTVKRDDHRPVIVSTGTVRPVREVMLSPRVGGEVIRRSRGFNPGETVEKGDLLLQIDPSDFKNTLQLRESDLQQALAELDIEKGQQEVARLDFQQSEAQLSEENRDLVLRIPQLNSAESEVASARAAVEQAQLDLDRTSIKAPFDAQILSRNVDVGSQVSPGDELARLVGTEYYWVEATVPQAQVQWLSFSGRDEDEGSEVKVQNRNAWEEDVYRTGHLDKMVGELEDQTRFVRVLVRVDDPLGVQNDSVDKPAMMLGSFVETRIHGREIGNVIRLSRDYVRKNQTVWVMADEKLEIREVDIVLSDAEYAYIREGLEDNEKVVTTNLATVVEGSPLRLEEE